MIYCPFASMITEISLKCLARICDIIVSMSEAKTEYVDWLNVKVIQKAIIEDEAGNMLALRRSEGPPVYSRPGKWDLPGGSIDAQDLENLEDGIKPHLTAIAREIREETGLEPISITPLSFDSWTFQKSPGNILGMAIGYQAIVAGEKPPIQRSGEHMDELWGPRQEVLALDFGDDGGLHPSVIRAV